MGTQIQPPPVVLAPPKRKRRWLLPAVALLACFIAVPTGLYVYLNYATRADWAEAEAEADRLDPGWRLNELLAQQQPIPDKENSALHMIGIAAKKKDYRVKGAPNYEPIFDKLPPNARLNPQQLTLLRAALDKIGKPLEEARQLKDFPRGRFFIRYSDDYISTLIPDHHSAREIADWLMHDAIDLAEQGKFSEAIDSCRACLNSSRVFADDLFLISHLIRIAIQGETLIAVERVLAQGEVPEPALETMQQAVARAINDSSWLRAMRGERAGGHMLFENIRSGKIKVNNIRAMLMGRRAENVSEWIDDAVPSLMLKYYPDHLRKMTRAVEIAKLPLHEQRQPIKDFDLECRKSKNPITRLLRPPSGNALHAECRGQAHLRALLVGLACERYRMSTKGWPKTLDELVKAKLLDAVPLDPIDGQPLRYRGTRDGIVIYSIGTDEKDDNGAIDRDNSSKPGVDFGIRLYDRELRRGPARPMVVVQAPPEGAAP